MDLNNLQLGDTITIQEKDYEVLDITEEKDPETKQLYLLIQLDKNYTIKYFPTTETCYLCNQDNKTLIKADEIKLL
ncbi:MAG: hypothetical protein Q7R56_02240 [Nanoarchaeota archaeon]|nr:hypothetical protein [Nanoarchaeota archaeon]